MWKCVSVGWTFGIFMCAHSVFAVEVVWNDSTPQNEREWADKDFIREQMIDFLTYPLPNQAGDMV